ncbi:hydrogenase 4 subunit B [Candidatus Roizmanbacteria bacterium CG_4_10_14_0_2_um_filter_39_12]|nr:MAG: hydrogenase 4 subunit B [Candidatus Roizmanbacteria bacterium CG_4_10_14_0_2_um_filter_39_12]
MTNVITSEFGFLFLLFLYGIGAIGSLIFRKNDVLANRWQSFSAIIGSLWGIFFAMGAFVVRDMSFAFSSSISPLLSFSFHIDQLSAFFIFVISLITLFCSVYGIGYIKHYYNKYSIGALGFFYHLFIAGMLMVVTASNGLFFLIAWELMSIASYFLVVYDRNDANNVKAGFLYLVMTHVGTAFIVVAFLLIYTYTGSFDFTSIQSQAALIPAVIKDVIFLLALVGFGTKAGIIPFHIWLPAAHPAAPSHVSALMSGVMIKTGIYMMIRIFLDMLQPVPLWWGIMVLIVGSVSALLGVLYALTEHDIKKLLAYHSIENIGIILLGLGSALVFTSLGNTPLALLGLGAGLFHTLNHATFKSLLFLSAGSVINQTHTRNMEKFGGLIKFMPQTALFFFVGSMAISALPPFNGFFSEWLTFQTLLQGIASADIFLKSIFILATGALAATGGLALACFVKAFGATFLARPRSPEVFHAQESSLSQSVGMGGLAILCLVCGVFSGYLGSLFVNIGTKLSAFQAMPQILTISSGSTLIAPHGFGSVSAPVLFALFVLVVFTVIILIKFAVNKNQKTEIGATWDCGTNLTPRMEITSTGFARSIILIFAGILRPSVQHEIEYHDSAMRYFPKSRIVNLSTQDIYQSYLYQPLNSLITGLSVRFKVIQSGSMNVYVSYILIVVVVTIFLSQ